MSSRFQKIVMAMCLVALVAWALRPRPEPLAPVEKFTTSQKSKIKPRSAAPLAAQPTPPAPRKELTVKDLFKGKSPSLNQVEVDAFLKKHGRTAANLITASRLLSDLTLLREAAQATPTDPMIQLELAFRGETPEEKQAGVDQFRQLAPDNSLGNYLAAHLAFKSGDIGTAGAVLLQSLDNPLLANYEKTISTAKETALSDVGYDPTVAKISALFSGEIYQLQPLMGVRDGLKILQDEFIRTADFDSAEPTVMIGLTLGQRIQDQGPHLIDQVYGAAIERTFLQQLDPTTLAGPNGTTAGERLEALESKLREIQAFGALGSEFFETLDAPTRAEYLQITSQQGEWAAMRWIVALKAQGK